MPVFPHPAPSPGPSVRPRQQRASDADRDTAVDILCAAAADGRLTMTELDERLGAALSARTRTQLAELIADVFPAPASAPARPARRAPAVPGDRWALLRVLVESA